MSNKLTAGGFTIELSEQDVAFYRQVSQARQAEAESWQRVIDAVYDYVKNHVVAIDNEAIDEVRTELGLLVDCALADDEAAE